jgi:hypothetical protein
VRKQADTGRRFCFENLENRVVLSGTAVVQSFGSFLSIIGDKSNTLVVHQVGKNVDGGAIIQVIGAGTKIKNADTGKTGTSFNFGNSTGITDTRILLPNGNNALTFCNTTLSGTIEVDMLGGNESLTMTNVHSLSTQADDGFETLGAVALAVAGNGRNVEVVTNCSSRGDFETGSGPGTSSIVLNHVSTGKEDQLFVNSGSGNHNTLSIIDCSAGALNLFDSGPNGVLSGVGNSFDSQFDVTAFRYRSGDLVKNKA